MLQDIERIFHATGHNHVLNVFHELVVFTFLKLTLIDITVNLSQVTCTLVQIIIPEADVD